MGHKRIQNILDDQIGQFLADFEKDLTDRIRGGVIGPLDGIEIRIGKIEQSIHKAERAANRTEQEARAVQKASGDMQEALNGFKKEIALIAFGYTFVGGTWAAAIVLAVQLLFFS